MLFSMHGFMDSRIKCAQNNVKRVWLLDPYLFSTPPFMKKDAIIVNLPHKNASTEMAMLFSRQQNIFLKSEVT